MQFLLLLLLLNHLMFIVICIYMYAIPFVAFVTEPSNVYCHLYPHVCNSCMQFLLLLLLLNHLMFIVICIYMYAIPFVVVTEPSHVYICIYMYLLLLLSLNHNVYCHLYHVCNIYMYAIPFVAFVTEPSNVYCHLYLHVCNSFCCFRY